MPKHFGFGFSAAMAPLVIAASVLLSGCAERFSRDDFAAQVKDKSEQEVVTIVGKPSRVDASMPERVQWTYTSRTFNIESGNKFDARTTVVFSPVAPDGALKVTE